MKNSSWYSIPFLCLLNLSFINCSGDNDGINQPPVADFTVNDMIDTYHLVSSATDADSDVLTYEWKSDSELISINDPKNKNAYFELPEINEPKTIDISHIVYDGQTYVTATRDIQLPILTNIRSWGLGRVLEREVSNDVDYDWYMDQRGTGPHSIKNCGPTTATMAIKWFDQEFSKTPEDARNLTGPTGNWWNTHNIINYLNKYSVHNITIDLKDENSLIFELENGNIIILCLDMYYVRNATNDQWHIDKFYRTQEPESGHFIILKGYKLVDGQLFFEAYDSGSWGAVYKDNSFKGKNRYYRYIDLEKATDLWWDYAIIVSKEKFKSSHGVDTAKILHKYGR